MISLLPSEDDDGLLPETETRCPHGLQGAVQQVFPSHMNVDFGILIQVLLSEQAQDGVQVECALTAVMNRSGVKKKRKKPLFLIIYIELQSKRLCFFVFLN